MIVHVIGEVARFLHAKIQTVFTVHKQMVALACPSTIKAYGEINWPGTEYDSEPSLGPI